MVKKTISGLTLEEAKEAFETTVSNIVDIIQTIPEYEQHTSLGQSRHELETFLNMVHTNDEIGLETKQIDDACNLFVKTIIYDLDSQLSNQLESYWSMIMDLGKKAFNSPQSQAGFHPMNIALKSKEALYRSDQLQREAERTNSSKSESMLLRFYSHIVRTNSIEHCLLREIETSLVQFKIENSHDTKKMFSVSNSVPKGSSSVTDARAMADALSYGKYGITTDGQNMTVAILNDENGYRFQRELSEYELGKTQRSFSLLYRCQIMLLLFYAAYVVAKTALVK